MYASSHPYGKAVGKEMKHNHIRMFNLVNLYFNLQLSPFLNQTRHRAWYGLSVFAYTTFFYSSNSNKKCTRNKNTSWGKIQNGCTYTTNYPPSSGNQCTMFGNCPAKWLINNWTVNDEMKTSSLTMTLWPKEQ